MWHAGPPGRTRRRIASPSQSSRSSSTASVFPEVSPLRQRRPRERLKKCASPVSRVRRSASSSIQASMSTRLVSASWTIAARQLRRHREAGRRARGARRAGSRAAPGSRGGSRRAAPPGRRPSTSAMCRAEPAPPDAITGSDTAVGHRARELEVVAVARAVRVDRREEDLSRPALLGLPRPVDSRASRRLPTPRASAPLRSWRRRRRRRPASRGAPRARSRARVARGPRC